VSKTASLLSEPFLPATTWKCWTLSIAYVTGSSPLIETQALIDAVPERDDLGCLQMITSTAHFDEVRHLLDQTLALMGLSGSMRNCEYLPGYVPARAA
jgi:hypothetical protein